MECLNGVIGVDTVGTSGLYLNDTTTGRIPLDSAFFADNDRIIDIIPNAINEAIGKLIMKLETRLTKVYGLNRSVIGFKDDYTSGLTATSDYYYFYLKPNVRDSFITINDIKIRTINGYHTGNIKIIQDGVTLYDDLLSEFTKTTFELNETIYFAYQGDAPLNIKSSGCCGKISTHSGYVRTGGGVTDLTDMKDTITSDFTSGFVLDVVFDCDGLSGLCYVDWKRSNFGIVFAKLIQQIARKNIIYFIQNNDKVNAYSECKEDELKMLLDYLIDDIDTLLNFLPEAYNLSNCYKCNGSHMGEILV